MRSTLRERERLADATAGLYVSPVDIQRLTYSSNPSMLPPLEIFAFLLRSNNSYAFGFYETHPWDFVSSLKQFWKKRNSLVGFETEAQRRLSDIYNKHISFSRRFTPTLKITLFIALLGACLLVGYSNFWMNLSLVTALESVHEKDFTVSIFHSFGLWTIWGNTMPGALAKCLGSVIIAAAMVWTFFIPLRDIPNSSIRLNNKILLELFGKFCVLFLVITLLNKLWESFVKMNFFTFSIFLQPFTWTAFFLILFFTVTPLYFQYRYRKSDQLKRSPEQFQFIKAVRDAAMAFGAGEAMAESISIKLGPDLFALFQNLAEALPAKKDLVSDQPEPADFEYVYADWLFDDNYKAGQQIPKTTMEFLLKGNVPECTFAVNETKGRLHIWRNGILHENKLPDKVPAMLWLVMTHVGTKISFKKIRDLFGYKPDPKGNEVYLPRNELKRFFDLGWNDNMMEESSRTERYFVADKGWSFYWFRPNKNPRFSELVHQNKKKQRLVGFDLLYYEQAMQAHSSASGNPCDTQ